MTIKPPETVVEIEHQLLPKYVTASNRFFEFTTDYAFVTIFCISTPLIFYCFDSASGKSFYLEKLGIIFPIIGLLMTIKHRFVKNGKTFKDYNRSYSGVGTFDEYYLSKSQAEKVKGIAKEETTGFWIIILGTILGLFAQYIPLIT
ncbi:hypothetical protein [Desulfosediminicola ganghwensis]|uniref:hypothetical protein n=1 Tax=Desulfosediminicola ganghwensis TaxID=2569540 RepID=UPI0010AC563A|nr:hypothetical protein [Desulfosediminicola ganghwensis]